MHKGLTFLIVFFVVVFSFTIYYHGQYLQNADAERHIVSVYNSNNLHAVRCISDNGDLDTYFIFIPPEVSAAGEEALEKFAKGYCVSLRRSIVE